MEQLLQSDGRLKTGRASLRRAALSVRDPERGRSLAQHLRQNGTVSATVLWHAQSRATRLGVRLDEVLLAEGALSAPAVCDALAVCLRLPRLRLAQALRPDRTAMTAIGVPLCLRHAVLPLRGRDGSRWLALRHPDDRAAVAASLPPDWAEARLMLATEAELQTRIADIDAAALTAAASARVPAQESCRTWHATPQRRVLLCGLLLSGILLLFALAPVPMFAGLIIFACIMLMISAAHKLAALVAYVTAPPPPPPPLPHNNPAQHAATARLPRISVLVPLFRERDIAGHLVQRLSLLRYPKALLDVVLVLEACDDTTRAALARTTLPPWMRSLTVPEGWPRTKPRAMNYALDFCRGDIIGIWDAEDAPAPDQLNRVAAHFATAAPDVACLQGVLDYYNPRQNWRARCFTIEYASWFRVMMPGMTRLGFAIPLGGTTLFFRRDVLENLGGWDAHNVTEDADLGFRLARHGWRTEMIDTTTGEEANCHLWPWVRQRSRWLKGYMVTWIVHMRDPVLLWRQLGTWRFLGMQTHFITALTPVLLAPLLWSFWLILLGLPHPLQPVVSDSVLRVFGWMFMTVEAINLAVALVALRGPAHRHLIPWVPTLHLYFPLGCLAAYKALWELLRAPFYWDKTAHGLSLIDARTVSPAAGGAVATAAP